MKRTIEKFAPIEHPSLTLLKEYFENLEIDLANQPKVSNFTVYIKDGETTLGKNLLEDLKKTFLSHFLPQEIFDSIYEAIDYIKSQYDVRIMWLMFYQPKTNLAFHIDSDYNRYAISIFDNERFFNYECTQLNYDNVQMYSEEMNKHIDNIDTFNEFFISHSPKNAIKVLESNNVYVFNGSIHNFFNGSDKLRVNFIFETNDDILQKEFRKKPDVKII